MKRSLAIESVVAVAFLLPTLSLAEDLYLLKGSMGPNDLPERWHSAILRVDEKAGRLSIVRDLGTDKFEGIGYTFVNYEHRVIVLGMPVDRPTTWVVVDMDDVQASPLILKPDLDGKQLPVVSQPLPPVHDPRVKIEPPTATRVVGANLLSHPGFGVLLGLSLIGPNGTSYYGLPINKKNPGQGRGLLAQDRVHISSSGAIGVGYHAKSGSAVFVSPFENTIKLRGVTPVETGVPSPPIVEGVRAAGRPFLLGVNDGRSLVMQNWVRGADTSKAGDGSSTIYIRFKKGNKWLTPTVPGDKPLIRAIGKYLLGVARTEDMKHQRPGAGAAELDAITKSIRYEDGIAVSSVNLEAYYPGILFAINVETGKMFQWRTDQADSEILWADDTAFYYRRANELLKVDIVQGVGGPVIGPVSTILKADVLLDVHAAFRGK